MSGHFLKLHKLSEIFMENEIEIEKTYLAKSLPSGLDLCKSKEIIDLYIPKSSPHAKLRIRKSGDSYTITKKKVVNEGDASTQIEQNIEITKEEFDALSQIPANTIRKIRYYYPYGEHTAEIDVFMDRFEGLALIDIEFNSQEELQKCMMPDFCLADVTNEDCFAGGVLSHSDFSDIRDTLEKFNYNKLFLGKNL